MNQSVKLAEDQYNKAITDAQKTSWQDLNGQRVLVNDLTGAVIKNGGKAGTVDTGSSSVNDDLNSIRQAGGDSFTWTSSQWSQAEAQFVNNHLFDLGSVKAKSVFEAQFPKPATAKSGGILGTIGGWIGGGFNYLKNLTGI